MVVKGKYISLLDKQLSCYLAYWANSMLNSRFLNTMLYLFKSPQKFSGVHGTIHGHHFKSISCQLGNQMDQGCLSTRSWTNLVNEKDKFWAQLVMFKNMFHTSHTTNIFCHWGMENFHHKNVLQQTNVELYVLLFSPDFFQFQNFSNITLLY